MEWYFILWIVFAIITFLVSFFLTAIDVIDPDFALILTVSIVFFPLGIATLIGVALLSFYDFLHKHKDKIRNFLGIKTTFHI